MKSLRIRTFAITVVAVLVGAALATGTAGARARAAASPRRAVAPALVPAGFTDTVVAAVPSPSALAEHPTPARSSPNKPASSG
jgi:hypothetical protein